MPPAIDSFKVSDMYCFNLLKYSYENLFDKLCRWCVVVLNRRASYCTVLQGNANVVEDGLAMMRGEQPTVLQRVFKLF